MSGVPVDLCVISVYPLTSLTDAPGDSGPGHVGSRLAHTHARTYILIYRYSLTHTHTAVGHIPERGDCKTGTLYGVCNLMYGSLLTILTEWIVDIE